MMLAPVGHPCSWQCPGTKRRQIFRAQKAPVRSVLGQQHLGVRYGLGLPPTQDSSHHQDYETYLVGNPYKQKNATVTGWGVDPMYGYVTSVQW